ncbi:hypothetical protein FACS189425_08540 [Clostridia bacterium]|nr:hypothetical protein FACS189425_08540 [Clostridia bacterium]
MYFYALPPRFNDLAAGKINIFKWLTTIPAGQYFIVTHPAFYGEEMLKTGNAGVSGEKVAKDRDKEARLYSSKAVCLALKLMGFQGVRYDGAAPLARRLTVDDVMTILRG